MISRRQAFIGLSAAIAAPFVIRTPGLLMPVRDLRTEAERVSDQIADDSRRKHLAAVREIERLRAGAVQDDVAPEDFTEYRPRDWTRNPPTLAEVIDWRRGMNAINDRGILVSWTGEGMIQICEMGEAETRFRAMGLL